MILVHRSNSVPPEGAVLDPNRLGENHYTKKDCEVCNYPRSYFNVLGSTPEHYYSSKRPFYADVPDDAVYDVKADPEGLVASHVGPIGMLLHRLHEERGYRGLQYADGVTVAMFEPTRVSPELPEEPVKLARIEGDDTLHGLVAHIHGNPHDSLGYGMLADHLEESGHEKEAHAIRFVLQHQADPGKVEAIPFVKEGNQFVHPDGNKRLTPTVTASHAFINKGTNIWDESVGMTGIHLLTPDHFVHLVHRDPTDKLLAEYRKHTDEGTSRSLAVAKKRDALGNAWRRSQGFLPASEAWHARHAALSQLAYHLMTFGDAEKGKKLASLLKKRGYAYVVGAGNAHRTGWINPGDVVHEGVKDRLTVYREKPGTPTRLARLRAPAGGAVVNNAYSKGGGFLPTPHQPVRSVMARLKGVRRNPAASV